jgi:hypothetical protein
MYVSLYKEFLLSEKVKEYFEISSKRLLDRKN